MQYEYPFISNELIKWYNSNKRELPWRETKDPYLIWISEIILQQTRVVQGYEYYIRFTETYPNITALANASEHEVLKLWQGLGYYSRARNLHMTAKIVADQYKGVFPTEYKDVLALKGIGDYTAAAITSFAYDLPYAVVDGNVYRFLSRLFAISTPINTSSGKKEFAELAEKLLDTKSPAAHNQSIMEFGALQCTPTSPKCTECPLSSICIAYSENNISKYPIKLGKTKVKERFFNYLDIRCDSNIYLNKRVENDIWKNLYELPLIETNKHLTFEELQDTKDFVELINNSGKTTIRPMGVIFKHVLSHRIIYATFYKINIANDALVKEKYTKVDISELSTYPISRLVDRYFEQSAEPDLFK